MGVKSVLGRDKRTEFSVDKIPSFEYADTIKVEKK